MSEGKTVAQVFEEVKGNASLQKEFFAAEKSGAVEAFAADHGCKATAEEVQAFLKAKLSESGELSDEELEQVAGGDHKTDLLEEKKYTDTHVCPACSHEHQKAPRISFDYYRSTATYQCEVCGHVWTVH